ncbi:MAG: TetR/AcrR family transcriptional regulator [Bacteroidetes bacterium]|nr:MAG: TetR/AcrR family transcriptional regulator [Bacteroidota bacterium]
MTKSEKTKQYIIEKTAPLFNTKGFAGTSLNDMVSATGLTKGSIYGNFKNKDEVAAAAFECNFERIEELIEEEMKSHRTYRSKLLAYAKVYENFLKEPFPIGGCPILNTAIESDDTHPELKKKANAALISWKYSIAQLIKKGIEGKEFKKSTNPDQIAITLLALLEGGIMIGKLTGNSKYKKDITKAIENLVKDI